MTKPTAILPMISVCTAASRLKLTEADVLALCEEHGVTVHQFGQSLRVRQSDLICVLMACRRPTERELAGRLDVSYRLAEAEILGDDAGTASPGSHDGQPDDASTSARAAARRLTQT